MRRLGPWAAIGPASEQDAPQAGLPAPGAGQAPRRSGLRERKKARTRAAIRQHALRLIREQGYAATTVDQIADAAEVSPSTFFRYFPTKEDVVLRDDVDLFAFEAFEAQPPGLGPIAAMRAAIAMAFSQLPASELEQLRETTALTMSVPELRARALDEFIGAVQIIAEAIAKRTGHDPGEFTVRNFAGALVGVMLSASLALADDPSADFATVADAALAHLEAGLPL
ncbi:MAG TPA: TetR family transcriptional regulator [Streptosporangiaceae bacterium]|nr:TetR family transcriptional regulator [Streptosporangiaceae bacterium]